MSLTCTLVFNHSDVINNHSDKGGKVDICVFLVIGAQITTMEPNHNQLVVVLPQNRTTRGPTIRSGHVPYVRACMYK